MPRWQKFLAVLGMLFVLVLFLVSEMSKNMEIAYAKRVVFSLQEQRDLALRSDVPEAAKQLLWVSEGHNSKQKPGSPLDQICNLQRTNVMRDIIVYLRAKTGEDLGDKPEPWMLKYAPKQ